MKKFKISIEKFFEEEIEATTEEEAVDKVWKEWEKEKAEIYIDEAAAEVISHLGLCFARPATKFIRCQVLIL